jgi:hypothetical protein
MRLALTPIISRFKPSGLEHKRSLRGGTTTWKKREGSWLDFFTFLSLSPINAILPLPLSRLLLIKMNRRERKSKHKKGDDL